MKTLDRYIGIRLLWRFLLVAIILSSLFSFLMLVRELDDIGTGDYRLGDVFAFVALTMPGRFLDLMPVSVLLGAVLALGSLAGSGELMAMQTAGMSVSRIGGSVLGAGAFLMAGALLLAEFVVPPLEQFAQTQRSIALTSRSTMMTRHGYWARQDLCFLHVRKILPGGIPAEVDIYEFDEEGRIRTFLHAREADARDRNQWVLLDVVEKVPGDPGLTTRRHSRLPWDSFLNARQIDVLGLPPGSLSLTDLYQYVRALRKRGQNADVYALTLWKKGIMPLTTGAMVLLSLPFVFGPMRTASAGKRITLGAVLGITYYFADQILGYMALLFHLHPALVTAVPGAMILFIALCALRRIP